MWWRALDKTFKIGLVRTGLDGILPLYLRATPSSTWSRR
jgi:hypothetical protein